MGQILVRKLDDAVLARLKLIAARDSKSVEQVARDMLTDGARRSKAELLAEMDRIRARTKYVEGEDSTTLIRKWRDSVRIGR